MKQKIVAILILLAAASSASATPAGEDFAPCGDAAGDPRLTGSLCARFQVPIERGVPGGDQKISLFLRKFPASAPSRGQVWLVAGERGEALYPLIGTMRQAFPGYDLIVPDRRAPARTAAYDLQAEIDRYAAGATLLYGASQGGEVVLKTLPLVRPRHVEAVILDSPVMPDQSLGIESQGIPAPPAPEGTAEPGLGLSPPRTLVLQGGSEPAPPPEIEQNGPVTTYTIEGAPSFLMLTTPECAAPLVRSFLDGPGEDGAPCATRLTIHF